MNLKKRNAAKLIANNKKARFNYEILDTYEAGIALLGTEVKSLRINGASMQEGYIENFHNELFLTNVHIAEFHYFGKNAHNPIRKRKLLLHKNQISKLINGIKVKGFTIVPLKMYFNDKGRVKIEIALAKGKKLFDKRSVLKERDAKRDADKALKAYRGRSYQ